jgi:dTDP-4-dehydrorhamnose reductase
MPVPIVLVVGRGGQLARALPPALGAAGFLPVVLGRPELDLTDCESLAGAVRRTRPALVVNAAAYTSVDKAEDEPWPAEAANACGPGMLAEAACTWGAAFVQVSTDYVFSGLKGAPYTEADSPAPCNIYGASKLAGEWAVRNANPRSAVLRTAWVCSVEGQNFLRTVLRLAATRAELCVVADQLGAPTFADDLADAVARMAPRLIASPAGDAAFGTFHLTGAPHTSWHGFAEAILAGAAARGHRAPPLRAITSAEFPTRATRPADARLDCAKIARVHGIAAPDWRASLERALDTLIGPRRAQVAARPSTEGIAA